MTNTFLSGLVQLGAWFRGEMAGQGSEDEGLLRLAEAQNRWFTPAFIRDAMQAHGRMLQEDILDQWFGRYPDMGWPASPRKIGLVLAGNLPMVGWHDVLCVLASWRRRVARWTWTSTT